MDWNSLHLIKGDNINIVYHYPTYHILTLNNVAFQLIELLQAGMTNAELVERYKDEDDNIDAFIHFLETMLDKEMNLDIPSTENKRVVDRITLHVSNDCNLRCKYCFAGGGNYNQERSLMSVQTGKEFVDFCTKYFDRIGEVVFFGGEPLMNVEVMEFICTQFKACYETGASAFIPRFCIITNGTLLTPRILEFIKKNISFITVSIDGPETVNDANRVYKNGKGSYKKIASFIHSILNETHVKIQYEATFTQFHREAHYEQKDIAHALRNEFGIKGLVVNEKNLEPRIRLENVTNVDYESLIETDFEDLPNDFWNVLHAVVRKEIRQTCPIVKGTFAVAADGILYPCQMLNGVTKCNLGTIQGENIFNSPTLYAACSSNLPFKESKKCKTCWGQKLCGGCTVQRYYNEEKGEFTMEPHGELCGLTLSSLEQILLMIAMIRKKPAIWSALVEKERRL